MRLWVQISFARCWFDQARLPCCWCNHGRNRLVDLLGGAPDRLSLEAAESESAITAHARRPGSIPSWMCWQPNTKYRAALGSTGADLNRWSLSDHKM